MVKNRKIKLAVSILLLFSMITPTLGDECGEKCTSPCTALKCHTISDVPGGCWFNGVDCINCKDGDRDINICEDYGIDSCEFNPCGISGSCKWVMDTCISSDLPALRCKTMGCKFGYRCMADGECVHFSVSVQEYCNTAYKEHGLFYDLSDPRACENVGKVCTEIGKKCDRILNETTIESKIKEECIALKQMCLQCQGDCELRKNVGDIEGIIYGIAAGIAILMLTINGIRLLTSEDSISRDNAKKSMVYVILSLLIIVIAVKFIGYVWISFL